MMLLIILEVRWHWRRCGAHESNMPAFATPVARENILSLSIWLSLYAKEVSVCVSYSIPKCISTNHILDPHYQGFFLQVPRMQFQVRILEIRPTEQFQY